MEGKLMLTYLTFLLLFIGIPLAFLFILYLKNLRREKESQKEITRRILIAIAIVIIIAFIYTTPWDNYLVENAIWYYETSKVMGLVIGFVPIEEYTFFIVQTLLVGLFFGLVYIRRNPIINNQYGHTLSLRLISSSSLLIIWFVSFFLFIKGIESFKYLNLILLWGIPPILIQLIYGVDIILRFRRDLVFTISLSTLYLSIADAIAIKIGIWTISTGTSTGFLLLGLLPIEEFIFFLVTNVLITFGLTLILDSESIKRFNTFYSQVKQRFSKKISGKTGYSN